MNISGMTLEMRDEAHALIRVLDLVCPVFVPSVISAISYSDTTV
jgi:hypothetical protein